MPWIATITAHGRLSAASQRVTAKRVAIRRDEGVVLEARPGKAGSGNGGPLECGSAGVERERENRDEKQGETRTHAASIAVTLARR